MNKLSKTIGSARPNSLARALLALAMVALIVSILITSVEFCAKDSKWLRNEYLKLDISEYTGMSVDDMCSAFTTMVNFMTGKSDSMSVKVECFGYEVEMYDEREIEHMYDVRELYSNVIHARTALIILAAFGTAVFICTEKSDRLYRICRYFLISLAAVVAAIVLICVWAVLDFSNFWIVFHIIFLDIEGSVFDPAISRMIRICPEKLFFDMIIRIFTIGLGVCMLVAVVMGVYLLIRRKNKKAY